jgi:bacterioferritin (cytochrome b1)
MVHFSSMNWKRLMAYITRSVNQELPLRNEYIWPPRIASLGNSSNVGPVKTSNDPVEMLRADLENERTTVGRYRERIRQAEAMGEFALSDTLRAIIVQEQEHEIDLAAALGIDVPPAIVPVDVKNVGILVKDAHAPRR